MNKVMYLVTLAIWLSLTAIVATITYPFARLKGWIEDARFERRK